MKKTLDELSSDLQLHMNTADDLTEDWYTYRVTMTKLFENMTAQTQVPGIAEISPMFFLRVALKTVFEEQRRIREIMKHRRIADRLIKKINKQFQNQRPSVDGITYSNFGVTETTKN